MGNAGGAFPGRWWHPNKAIAIFVLCFFRALSCCLMGRNAPPTAYLARPRAQGGLGHCSGRPDTWGGCFWLCLGMGCLGVRAGVVSKYALFIIEISYFKVRISYLLYAQMRLIWPARLQECLKSTKGTFLASGAPWGTPAYGG